MTHTKNFRILPILACASMTLFGGTASAQTGPNDSTWIPLFNKADTNIRNNWDIKIRGSAYNVDNRRTFRYAINGADTSLEVNYSGYTNFSNAPDAGGSAQETFGHAAYKHRPFSHYLLRVEYQVWGTQVAGGPGWANQNNGLMLHSQPMSSMGVNQNFPVSMEVQLLGPANGSSTMNLCTPGTSFYTVATGGSQNNTHCTNSSGGPTRAPINTGWQSVEVRMYGADSSVHISGGVRVFKYYRAVNYNGDNQVSSFLTGSGYPKANGSALSEGHISIQGESAPYRFRKIELLNLAGCMNPANPNYKSYFVASDTAACNPVSVRAQAARQVAPMTFVDKTVLIGGTERVTVETYDMRGTRIGRHTAQAPFQWSPSVKARGVHVIRAITPKGTYTEKATLF